MRHRYSKNARSDTPLAIEYRRARSAYKKAGKALRKSCSKAKRVCGFPQRHRRGPTIALTVRSVKAMKSEFLSAPAGSGTNEDVIREQIGNLDVRDPTQWESVAEKYETGPLQNFADAFAIVARASRRSGSLRWDTFDLDVLRSCPGLDGLQMPSWYDEAQMRGEEAAKYYGEDVPF